MRRLLAATVAAVGGGTSHHSLFPGFLGRGAVGVSSSSSASSSASSSVMDSGFGERWFGFGAEPFAPPPPLPFLFCLALEKVVVVMMSRALSTSLRYPFRVRVGRREGGGEGVVSPGVNDVERAVFFFLRLWWPSWRERGRCGDEGGVRSEKKERGVWSVEPWLMRGVSSRMASCEEV